MLGVPVGNTLCRLARDLKYKEKQASQWEACHSLAFLKSFNYLLFPPLFGRHFFITPSTGYPPNIPELKIVDGENLPERLAKELIPVQSVTKILVGV